MLELLRGLQERAPVRFRLIAFNLDQKQPGFPDHILPDYFKRIGVEYRIETEDTYSIVKDKIPEGKTTCGLCSRLRRGIIYRVASELGATKIALGHHRDDLLETLFLNMFSGLMWSGSRSIELGLADDLGSVEYVARDVVKAADIVDFTQRQNIAERFAKQLGADLGESVTGALNRVGMR